MYNTSYASNNYINPSMNAQQRMEQLYYQNPTYFNQSQGLPNLKIFLVSNIEEAKATPADLLGSETFFYNKSMGEIYMKQIDRSTGAAPLISFALRPENQPEDIKQEQDYCEKFEQLNCKIDKIFELIQPQCTKVNKNDKQHNN